jgi:methionyl-tRNA formyltransferase
MKIVFFGTGDFGMPALKKLLNSGHDIAAVVTQPDKRKGRGWKVQPTPIKAILEKTAPWMPVFQPEELSDKDFLSHMAGIGADVFVVIDYGKILKSDILDMPGKYCVNLHPSLLPKYRGAAPVNRAILGGEKETGITVIKMNERMDAGDIILQEKMAIDEYESVVDLFGRLSQAGADLVLKALDEIGQDRERPIAQKEEDATYAPKLQKAEGKIEWARDASDIVLKVRGLQPWPGTYTYLDGKLIKVLQAAAEEMPEGETSPGQVISAVSKFIVSAGKGAVRIARLQPEGRKAMTSDEFLRGHDVYQGKVLG